MALYACSTDYDFTINNPTQKWELVKISGKLLDSEISGNTMDFQETYIINSDSTFIKTRTKNTEIWILRGTYNYMTYKNNNYIIFNYDMASPIIGNCSNNLNEVLLFSSKTESTNTWFECDGPKLDYRKIEDY